MSNLSNYALGSDIADAPWNAVEEDGSDEDVCSECGFPEYDCECYEDDDIDDGDEDNDA